MGRKAIDITGQRFGNLVVLRRSGTTIDTGGQAIWDCICDCGAKHSALGQALRRGTTTRCLRCAKSRLPLTTMAGKGTVVDLWFYAAGETGGFAVARDQDTGAIITHSHWNRKPLGAQPWQGYGALLFVFKRLVHMGRATARKSNQATERWCRQNSIILNPARKGQPHFFTPREALDALWAEARASGTGPEIIELDRGPRERRVTL
jgi:hypothetical protein